MVKVGYGTVSNFILDEWAMTDSKGHTNHVTLSELLHYAADMFSVNAAASAQCMGGSDVPFLKFLMLLYIK